MNMVEGFLVTLRFASWTWFQCSLYYLLWLLTKDYGEAHTKRANAETIHHSIGKPPSYFLLLKKYFFQFQMFPLFWSRKRYHFYPVGETLLYGVCFPLWSQLLLEQVPSEVLEVRRGGKRDGAFAFAVLEPREWGSHACTKCFCSWGQGMSECGRERGGSTLH